MSEPRAASEPLVVGDQVSCSRVGGTLRREAARLTSRVRALRRAEHDLAGWRGPDADAARARLAGQLDVLGAAADDLDLAGSLLQRYATALAEAHEVARRAEAAVTEAGLRLEQGRVVEPWGPTDAEESVRRRALVEQAQARADRARSQVGRARAQLQRAAASVTQTLAARSQSLREGPPPTPRSSPGSPIG